jgi:hypothetical protein
LPRRLTNAVGRIEHGSGERKRALVGMACAIVRVKAITRVTQAGEGAVEVLALVLAPRFQQALVNVCGNGARQDTSVRLESAMK